MMRFKYLVSFWLICSLFSCQDEKLVLSGTVLDAKDQQPIHQATILIRHKDSIDYPEHYLVATTTDSLGQFNLELEGSLNDKFLWIGYLGYEILETENMDSILKEDVFILNRDTSRHIDYIPNL